MVWAAAVIGWWRFPLRSGDGHVSAEWQTIGWRWLALVGLAAGECPPVVCRSHLALTCAWQTIGGQGGGQMSDERQTSGDRWTVRGVPKEAQDAASAAARAAGMKLGAWVAAAVQSALATNGSRTADSAELDGGDLRQRVADLERDVRPKEVWEAIDRLAEQVAALEGTRQPATIPDVQVEKLAEGQKKVRRLSAKEAAEMDRLLRAGELNNVQISELIPVTPERIRRRRNELGLPPVTTKRLPKRK